MIQTKRAYEPATRGDGYRVLIDRLWPRGIKKSKLVLDDWAKELAPSNELRRDFAHDPAHWKKFRSRFKSELRSPRARSRIADLAKRARRSTVTLVYSARDEEHNNAVVLKEVLSRVSGASKKRKAA